MSDFASLALSLFIVIAVMKLDVVVHFSIGYGSPIFVVGVIIFSVPSEVILSKLHVFDVLTLIGTCLIQDEGDVSGEYYFIGCKSISAAAVLDFGVLIVPAVWHSLTPGVPVVIILVIPFYPSLSET